jgi:hypothetical protein
MCSDYVLRKWLCSTKVVWKNHDVVVLMNSAVDQRLQLRLLGILCTTIHNKNDRDGRQHVLDFRETIYTLHDIGLQIHTTKETSN